MRHVLAIAVGAAVLAAGGVAVRAADAPSDAPAESPADAPARQIEALVRRLVSTKSDDRAKADADLAGADRDTLVAVARRLRDEFGPSLPRLAKTTLGVEIEVRWLDVAPDKVAETFSVEPGLAVPETSVISTDALLKVIQKSTNVGQMSASKTTVFDHQQATISMLERLPGGAFPLVTGVLLGCRPRISADAKTISLAVYVETRRRDTAPTPSLLGASWRTEIPFRDDRDMTIVFPRSFSIAKKDGTERRVALWLHAKIVDLGPSVIGTPINEFEPTFDAADVTPPPK